MTLAKVRIPMMTIRETILMTEMAMTEVAQDQGHSHLRRTTLTITEEATEMMVMVDQEEVAEVAMMEAQATNANAALLGTPQKTQSFNH